MFAGLCRGLGRATHRGSGSRRMAVGFICLLGASAAWPSAASAGQVTLTYIGYLVGIPVLSLTAAVTVPPSTGAGA